MVYFGTKSEMASKRTNPVAATSATSDNNIDAVCEYFYSIEKKNV
jgi:hypothetical protein